MIQSGVNQNHMEIMHKQQILKETCELPFISLTDQDEKLLFDLSVAIKFGNPQTVYLSCSKLSSHLLHDFPPEVFLQRTDILKSLLDLLEGSAVKAQDPRSGREWDMTIVAQQCLLVFLKKLGNMYRFLLHNSTKPNVMGAKGRDDEAGDSHIENTYPSTRLSRWEDSSTSYGAPSQ